MRVADRTAPPSTTELDPAASAAAPPRLARALPRLCDALAAALALVALLAGAWVATAVFDRTPHVEDEVAFLFQARTLAGGQVIAPAPEHPEFFFAPFIVHRDGHWFGKYPPGFPAVLALGARVDRAWLVNPVAAAGCIALLYLAGRRLYGPATGLLAAALLAPSPFFLLQSGALLSHVTSLFWLLAALLLFHRARRDGAWWAAAGCGAALGMVFLARPLTGVGLGLPFAAWMALDLRHAPRQALRRWLPAAAGALPFVALLLLYNRLTTGDPLRSAYELWWPYDRIGFGHGISRDGHYTFREALDNLWALTRALADFLYGWPRHLSLAPATLALLFLLVHTIRLLPHSPRTANREPLPADAFLAALALSLPLAYLAYWSDGQMYGPRYLFEATGPLALLSARGLLQLAAFLTIPLRRAGLPRPRHAALLAVLALAAALTLHSLTHFTPRQLDTFTGWYAIDRSGVAAVERAGLEDALVFVDQRVWTDYAPFFSANAPTLDTNVVYAIDRGDRANRRLLAAFPGRTPWRFRDGRLEPLLPRPAAP